MDHGGGKRWLWQLNPHLSRGISLDDEPVPCRPRAQIPQVAHSADCGRQLHTRQQPDGHAVGNAADIIRAAEAQAYVDHVLGDICCHGQLSASGVWPQTVLGQVRNPTRWREGHEPRGRKPHLVRVRLFLGSRLSASGHDGLPLDGRRDSPAGSSPHSHSPE